MNRMLYHIIYITISIYLLSACTNQEKQDSTILSPELQQVEAIMYQSPDSAFQLLQTIPVPPTFDSLQYATWALFTTQAKYKLYMKQSDSLINIAYPYFLRHGDAQRKALALYYKAVICKEQNKTEEAQRFCLEAAKEIDKTSDYSLSYLIYIEMADTYIYSDLKEYALETANKAYVSAQKSSEPRYVISSLIYLARINSSMGNLIKSTEYYKKTIDFAEKTNAYKTMASATTELIAIYSILKNNDAIRYYTRYYLTLQKKYNLIMDGSQYSVIGEAYQLLNQPDSAYYYLRQGLEVPSSYTNVYIKRALYYRLFHLAFDMLDYKSSAIYADKALIYNDSVNQADQSNALIEMQEKYNQQKLINERNELRIKKDRVTRNALMGLLIAACLIAILIYFYQRKLRKGEREIQEAKEEAKKKSLQIQENELIISRNLKRMKELTEQIEANKGLQEELEEQKQLLAEIRRQNETLEQKNKDLLNDMEKLNGTLGNQLHDLEQLKVLLAQNTYLHNREWDLFCKLMEQDKLLNNLKRHPHPIKEEEWEKIIKAMDDYWDNFTQRLTKAVPALTKNDLYLCCLMKLRLATPEIVTLLSIEPNSVYRRKNRLKERIIQETNSWEGNMTLDLWIWNF